MASGAKLQKSFQDYFRIPVLLKALGSTSQQKLSHIAAVFNQIDTFPINEQYFPSQPNETKSLQKYKKNSILHQKLKNDLQNRPSQESQKLLFLADDFANDWSQFQIIYKANFVILIYAGEEPTQQNMSKSGSSSINLNQAIHKINLRLRQKDKKLLGIIFLNDAQQLSKNLLPGLKFTIIPPSLPLDQLSMFIQPWLSDLIPSIQNKLIQQILECKQEQNTVIVFNRSEDKSQAKIMKKKKKYRCLKICGDLALMLHLYQLAYEAYHQADQQLRKVDDWMWVLGCIQGKLACMTCSAQPNISQKNIQKQIEQLMSQSFVFSKKIKYQAFQIQNLFKILKLLLHQDKQRFDQMVQTALGASKGLTQEQKFIYYAYIGSLYSKSSMQRKRNYYFYKASLITENFKPQVSELLLRTIKQSKHIGQWQQLNSKIIQKIIESQKYFSPNGEMYLELIEKCSKVLSQKEIQHIQDCLNLGNYEEIKIEGTGEKLIEIKQFTVEQSQIKPKPNRLIDQQSPRKGNASGIFVGWKKKLTWLYEDQQILAFKGTIVNKLPFEIHIKVMIQASNLSQKIPEFSLILPPSLPYKFKKQLSFSFTQNLISIKKIKFSIWNFTLYKTIEPQITFQLYEKQPKFQVSVEGGEMFFQQKQKIRIQIQQSSQFSLRCSLMKKNKVQCERLRLTCSIYYDIDVGFQENQYNFSQQNNFLDLDLFNQSKKPNIRFIESQQKCSITQYDQAEGTLVLKLRKFKATRNHIKKIQINLDYIKERTSKYQINKQYTIQPKITNSVWAQILQISTPQLQSAIKNMQNPTQFQIQQFCLKWNTIQDFYLAKVRFLKDKFNLRPFKVWYNQEQNNSSVVIGQNQVILSNLTEGEMWIKLQKYKVTLEQKQTLLDKFKNIRPNEKQSKVNLLLKPLNFKWQNIVNKNMQGSIDLSINPSSLIFRPKLEIDIRVEKDELKQKQAQNCKVYRLSYTISSEQESQIKPHKVSVKAYSQNQIYAQITANTAINQNQNSPNQALSVNNINILIKGKTKINRLFRTLATKKQVSPEKNQQGIRGISSFANSLSLKIIKQKLQEKINQKQKEQELQIIAIIQFDQKQIGKWRQVFKLQ